MSKVKEIINKLELDIEQDTFLEIIFEMGRYFDKDLKKIIQSLQQEHGTVFTSDERKIIRSKFYFGDKIKNVKISDLNIEKVKYNQVDIEKIINDLESRLKRYKSDYIIKSIKAKFMRLQLSEKDKIIFKEWLDLNKKTKEDRYDYSLVVVKINNQIFKSFDFKIEKIFDLIKNTYNRLENYRHISIVFDGEIFDNEGQNITWNTIYKIGIYIENFIRYQGNFYTFKKDKKQSELDEFLKSRLPEYRANEKEGFYDYICYGFKYEDLMISDDGSTKILIARKVELDERPIPCPSCLSTLNRGNSYPEVFLKSWECQNPSCPDRSKSGRGKRFDEFGTYRYFKMVENKTENQIPKQVSSGWRRDIFSVGLSFYEALIKIYSWDSEKVLFLNHSYTGNSFSREIIDQYKIKPDNHYYYDTFIDLPIYKFFQNINKHVIRTKGSKIIVNNVEVVNEDSSDYLRKISNKQIGSVITSPPYYNAREYSQWTTSLFYYVDMFINVNAVYDVLINGGYYLYNIGDIVSNDNVYVSSNMSNRRLPLGFMSSLIFEIAGFKIIKNIIWDKGEVQSKRNSTVNLFPGFVRCINAYEHVLVFKKSDNYEINNKSTEVKRINPVIKINSKGENKYKHTAPYPLEIVEIIRDYANKETYILDPFLGSGTTLVWCKENGFKGIGIEKNKEYFELALSNIEKLTKTLFEQD